MRWSSRLSSCSRLTVSSAPACACAFAVTALVTFLYIALIVLFHRVQDALFGAIGIWTYLIIPIVFVAGCIADGVVVRRKVKKQLASQNSGVRRLPEIDWNGMAPEK